MYNLPKMLTSIAAVLLISISAFANDIRVYCFYVPKDKLTASAQEQAKAAIWTKLPNPPTGYVQASWKADDRAFEVSGKDYQSLIDRCKYEVGVKGNMFDVKASDAAYFESFTYFYPLFPEGKPVETLKKATIQEVLNEIAVADAKKDLSLSDVEIKNLENSVLDKDNHALLQSIHKKLNKTKLEDLSQSSDVGTNEYYVTSALKVAAFLATVWFGQAYVAAGVRLLYPLVYHALWGIPAKASLGYWLVYLPGKEHAVHWAFSHSGQIITATTAILSITSNALLSLAQKFRQALKGSPAELKNSMIELNKSIVQK